MAIDDTREKGYLSLHYRTCENSISEAVNTIIWAAPRVGEAKELGLVRDQLASKFGKEFMLQALENQDEQVNPRVRRDD